MADAAHRLPEAPPTRGPRQRLAARLGLRAAGWRRHVLGLAALLGVLALALAARGLAALPGIDARWQAGAAGELRLAASGDPRLAAQLGATLQRLEAGSLQLPASASLVLALPRWTADDARRTTLVDARRTLAELMRAPRITLVFADGARVDVAPRPVGWRGLGLAFGIMGGCALLLVLVGAFVLAAHVRPATALFALMAACQALALLWLGMDMDRGLAPVPAALADDLPWRLGLDLTTGAAAVHLFARHPTRLPAGPPIAIVAWTLALMATLAVSAATAAHAWWVAQGALTALAMAAVIVPGYSHRRLAHPTSAMLRRLAWAVLATWLIMQAAVLASQMQPLPLHDLELLAVLAWSLFLAAMLAWAPFLSRAPAWMREFAMLAGLTTLAVSLHLAFVAMLALDPFASLTLAVLSGFVGYALARRWLLPPLAASSALGTERAFDQVVHVARELHAHPDRHAALLGQLLRDMFEPLEMRRVPRAGHGCRVLGDGAALAVPIATAEGEAGQPAQSWVLRFARGGERLFAERDAHLAGRIAEQLQRAVAYDRAVERGRAEERLRIAQDLHDDIGARLLTLMYKAQDPEVEDYLRHTLKDLKTLTRGLAAAEHRLSHAVVEWRADLAPRLTAAHVELVWTFDWDTDPVLTIVQWSALTRILRELASNAIAHARATRLEVAASLRGGVLLLQVSDDGVGRDPARWSHGLGLGGVRKRVKQLGGRVGWRELAPRGIACEVELPLAPPG